ncbi:MAG: hypothetical protein A3F11_05200 [Gammaproteobacteria bacterium RIFCSPHIGHO2_12_FULL_37_14]|nr:MAG: hypothetical protein A3F11_05200 [Gammaproteobacteria bacterium RIFCSPHIGHO2_12_FULL_37_14]
MLIGVNWISPNASPIIRELIDQGTIDFCEVMVDNFAHLPAKEIRSALTDIPIGLHVVTSRFLEKSLPELEILAKSLRYWIRELQPLYVSDHLARYTINAQYLPFVIELDYKKDFSYVKDRILQWQDMLESNILFENYASITSFGRDQVNFYQALAQEINLQMLFDFSNAYIAEYNQFCPIKMWNELIHHTNHFHVSGFSVDKTSQLAIDTHDTPLAPEVLESMRSYLQHHHQASTLVVEFDVNADINYWKNELGKVKKCISA